MTITERLEQIVHKWRDSADLAAIRVKADALRQCANELEAAMTCGVARASSEPARTDEPSKP